MASTLSPAPDQSARRSRLAQDSPDEASRILFAVSDREVSIFFGENRFESLFPASRHHSSQGAGWLSCLEEFQPEILVSCWTTQPIPEAWLAEPGCPLKYVCHLTGSVRQLVPRSFLERGGKVTNWGGLAAPQVAEHALLLALAGLRNLPDWRTNNWDAKLSTRTLFGKTVGIHGFGKVAIALCELLRPFRVRIKAYSPGVSPAMMHEQDVEPCRSLRELFAGCDVLIECEALNEASHGSVSEEILSTLPDGAVFVNVGRGLVVNEEALAREAASGRIAVAIDVSAVEPLPPDHPLAVLPEVIYSPHLAGPTGDRFRHCGQFALDNLFRYERRLPLEAQVTLEIYDRST